MGREVGDERVEPKGRQQRPQPGDAGDIMKGRKLCFLKGEVSLSPSAAHSALAEDGVTSIAIHCPQADSPEKAKASPRVPTLSQIVKMGTDEVRAVKDDLTVDPGSFMICFQESLPSSLYGHSSL